MFRSARPDERFLRWLSKRYGIQHVISLAGPAPAHAEARRLGMRVSVYHWRVAQPPPPTELAAVLEALEADEAVLLHCGSGADRTGYAVAALRLLHQGWPLARAVAEMQSYGHSPQRWPQLHVELSRLQAAGAGEALR